MKSVYRVLAYVIAAEVVIQAAAIAFAAFGLFKWVEDGGTLTKASIEDESTTFTGVVGFMVHGMNGTMLIPLIALVFMIVSFFAKIPGGVKRAAILFGLVALQIFLGIFSHSIPFVIVFHVLNAFAIFVGAFMTGRAASEVAAPAEATVAA